MVVRFRVLILLMLSGSLSFAGDFDLPCKLPEMFLKTLVQNHINPRQLNESTEKLVFENFMERLDPEGIILTSQQIDSLRDFVPGILDTTKQQSCIFLKKVCEVYKRRILLADLHISTIGKKSFQFNKPDSVFFDRNLKMKFTTSEIEIEKRRVRFLKYYFLSELFFGNEDSAFTADKIDELILKKEKEVREKTITSKHCDLIKLLDSSVSFELNVTAEFLESISLTFDPHSDYFTQTQRGSFVNSLSAEAGTFGLNIVSDEGKLVVANLTPGGPAWKSNLIHKGDYLVKMTTLKAKYSDLTCMEANQVEELINNSEGNWVELEMKNKEGKIQKVKLIKEKMRVDENNVNSCILDGKIKAGYISLPDFYSGDFMSGGPGCANDVAKEILKMQKAGIEGLILDLRYNGGGSIDEAVDLAGLFIDYGPIGIVRVKNNKPFILKDPNRGAAYSGKLIILVNGYSASASELLAGALQDHNRALIVGQPTYGKATGQEIIPVDKNQSPTYGFIKVTELKLYRLNGESNQVSGVKPDVVIPDINEGLLSREEEEPSVLPKDTINKKIEFTFPPHLPVDLLKSASAERIAKSNSMKNLVEENRKFKYFYNYKKSVSLQPPAFYQWVKEVEKFYADERTNKNDSNIVFKVENNTFDKILIKLDDYKREFIKSSNEIILNDAQIIEAYSILNDLISLTH